MKHAYSITTEWSEEDGVWIAKCREFPLLGTHGKDKASALREMEVLLDAVIKDMKERGEEIPDPMR